MDTTLELFSTVLLKYTSEFYFWYTAVVKVKSTEAILSARMNHFKILPYHHYHYYLLIVMLLRPVGLKEYASDTQSLGPIWPLSEVGTRVKILTTS